MPQVAQKRTLEIGSHKSSRTKIPSTWMSEITSGIWPLPVVLTSISVPPARGVCKHRHSRRSAESRAGRSRALGPARDADRRPSRVECERCSASRQLGEGAERRSRRRGILQRQGNVVGVERRSPMASEYMRGTVIDVVILMSPLAIFPSTRSARYLFDEK